MGADLWLSCLLLSTQYWPQCFISIDAWWTFMNKWPWQPKHNWIKPVCYVCSLHLRTVYLLGSWVLAQSHISYVFLSSCLSPMNVFINRTFLRISSNYHPADMWFPHVILMSQPAFYFCVSQVLTNLTPPNIFVKVFIGRHRPRKVETFPKPFGDIEQS